MEGYDNAAYPTGSLAALDSATAARLGVEPGDALLITAGPGTAAAVTLAGPPDGGAGVLRLDSLTRMVLGTRLGADAAVSRFPDARTGRVTVELDAALAAGEGEAGVPERVRRAMRAAAMPVVEGGVAAVPAGPLDSHVVIRTVAVEGRAGRVGDATRIDVEPADLREFTRLNNAGLADVGGLGPAISELREVMELAIHYPRVLDRLGITPVRGVILSGPPGGGKTLLCRSLAGEFDAAFYYLSGPEVVGSLHGQTEESLRAVFAEAADHAPAIICIDEVEALTRNRRALSNQADLRAVAQLLALMDGLRRARGVFVIGTTNQVHLLDPAFRRPGRFDREIAVDEPDERGRLEILNVRTRGMPLSGAARALLPGLARDTAGYSGADLASLCGRAAGNALRRIVDRRGLGEAEQALAEADAIDTEDLLASLRATDPASSRDSHVEKAVPVALAGRTPALDRLRAVADSAAVTGDPQDTARAGALRAGVLLTGPAGTGKSAIARRLAHERGLRLLVIEGSELATRWLGETEEAMRNLSELAARLRPSMLLLEHVEAMAPRRTPGDPAGAGVTGQLALAIGTLAAKDGVLVVGTTSRPDLVDESLLGPTGLRVRIDVGLPDEEDRAAVLAAMLTDRGLCLPADELRALAARSDGLTPADLGIAVSLAGSGARGPGAAPGGQDGLARRLEEEMTQLRAQSADTEGER